MSYVSSEPLPRARPEDVGLSSERLARIKDVVAREVEASRMPGTVLAVARRGKLVHFEAYGYLDKAAGTPMRTDAIFSIASMTKIMTTTAALILCEEGRLFLNDPVSKYLPQLAHMQVALLGGAGGIAGYERPKRPVTVQDLMRHTSGLIYGGRGTTPVHKMYPEGSASVAVRMTGAELLEKLASLPLLHQPGAVWDYGFSTDVLGLVVEAVSGKSLGAYLAETIWSPLAMRDTGFNVPESEVARYARALPNDPVTGQPQSVLDSTKPLRFESGGGGAVSTAGDYIRFGQMLLNRGELAGQRILSRKTVELATADHLDANVRSGPWSVDAGLAGYGFGLGFAVRRAAGVAPVMGSAGDYTWAGAFGTNFWADPKEDLAVVHMAHTPGTIRQHYREAFRMLVLQALLD